MSENTMISKIANTVGLTENTVRLYLCKTHDAHVTPGSTVEKVRRVAAEMGYVRRQSRGKHDDTIQKIKNILPTLRRVDHPVTSEDIAKALGVYVSTVRKAYSKNSETSEETGRLIRMAGETMGYIPGHRKPRTIKPEHFYFNGNYHTKDEETRRMEQLRAEGYSNAEIAKKIGRSYPTVVSRIGVQPIDMSKTNRAFSQAISKQKNEARRLYVRNHKIAEYNAKVEEHNALKAKVQMMEAEITTQKNKIDRVAAVQIQIPAMNLQNLQPTALN